MRGVMRIVGLLILALGCFCIAVNLINPMGLGNTRALLIWIGITLTGGLLFYCGGPRRQREDEAKPD